MDRRSRPIDARCRIAGALALALVAAGCGGNSYMVVSSSGAPATAVTTSGSVYAASSSSSGAFFLFTTLMYMFSSEEMERQAGMPSSVYPGPVPPMDASRKVNAQDCTRPIEDGAANLMCR